MGINPELYDSNYPSFSISKAEFEGISKMLQSGNVANLHRVVIEGKPELENSANTSEPISANIHMMSLKGVTQSAAGVSGSALSVSATQLSDI